MAETPIIGLELIPDITEKIRKIQEHIELLIGHRRAMLIRAGGP